MSVPIIQQQPTTARVYNAIYSSVQVYECMVRGIAVMRRRVDSYVNATQILKVAGIDKGRRTKILEKEILPGKHEIVQGGYGKYQGTWIPLERGRDVAMQFGVAPLLAPLFDYMPTPASVGTMPPSRLPPPLPVQIPHHAQPHLPPHLQTHHYMPQHHQIQYTLPPHMQGHPQHLQHPPPHLYANHNIQPPPYLTGPPAPPPPRHHRPPPPAQLQQQQAGTGQPPPRPHAPQPYPHPPQPSQPASQPRPQPHPQPPQPPSQQPPSQSSSQQSSQPPSQPGSQPSSQSTQQTAPHTALTLLQQGRAQGLFTPHSSINPYTYQPHPAQARSARPLSSTPSFSSSAPSPQTSLATISAVPTPTLKRSRPEEPPETTKEAGGDVLMQDDFAATTTEPTPPRRDGNGVASSSSQQPSPPKRPKSVPDTPDAVMESVEPAPAAVNGTVALTPPPAPIPPKVNPDDLKWRMFSKSSFSGDRIAPLKNAHANSVLTALVRDAEPKEIVDLLLQPSPDPSAPPPDVDLIIDDQGHTALHWASALARFSLVHMLIQKGADIHRGNHAGETPLIRSVLDPSAFESQSFSPLLILLSPSIRTVDSSSRSVLHHIALIAGVKTRSPSARYYMECVLEYVARHEGGEKGMKSLVDLQDIHGDTALNVAARVGNRSLVRNLVDVGANRTLGNKLGLKPGDFGVEGESLKVPNAGDILSTLRTGPPAPVQKSQDVITDMTTMIQSLSDDFSAELKVKQDALDVTQAHLRAATRQLAEQRRLIQLWHGSCTELDEVQQRIRNMERALKEEEEFDWTGRTELSNEPTSPANSNASPAFFHRGPSSTLSAIGTGFDVSFTFDVDPAIPSTDAVPSIVKLKRLNMWHARIEELMEGRLAKLKGDTADKEFMCKRIVSLCTGVPLDQVESMLDNLIVAMESDGAVPELGRVAGFMQKVKEGNF